MKAASEGLTLTAASDVVFCELAWTPAMHTQCVSRAYGRVNDMHGATAWYLLAPQTIDDEMYKILERKAITVAAVTDGVDISDDPMGNNSSMAELLIALTERGMN
jgi:SNF2 family DNA or RNA helicase